MPSRRLFLRTLAGAGALVATPGILRAQAWPARTIQIVVPYPAGGPTDAIARIVAQEIQGPLGQSVVVENRPGASGSIGTRSVAQATPDGHVLVLGNNQTHATNVLLVRELGYDPVRDFVGVAGLADLQHILVVKRDLAVQSVQDLVALARSRPGALNYGSTGNGAGSHLAMELFRTRTGIDVQHVPFRGAAANVQEMIAGRIDMSFATQPSVVTQIEANELRGLAVASPVRSPRLANLPTLAEAGVTGADADSWLALFAPARTPAEVVTRIHREVATALGKPDIQRRIFDLGMRLALRDPADLARYVPAEVQKWSDVIRRAGVQPEG